MKKFIYKINQYLLERFPTVWNTKIVWMLCISLVIHIVFYILGFSILSNVELLKERGASDIFFDNGTIFFSIIISIIMLVVWLSQLLKNNAFKSLYPTKRLQLFSQFFQYFIIIVVSSTFYFSYMFGLQNYINFKYDDSRYEKDIQTANDASVFLSHKLSDYTINQRHYPSPFDSIYCEQNRTLINSYENYFTFKDEYYQFYTLKTKVRDNNRTYDSYEYQGSVFTRRSDSTTIFYYKDKVLNTEDVLINYTQRAVDTSLISYPTYYNYSNSFFEIHPSRNFQYYKRYPVDRSEESKFKIAQNKKYFELLQKGDRAEIVKILDNFIALTNAYEIDRNIDVNQWQQIIFNSDGFKISALINNEKPPEFEIPSSKEKTDYQKFVSEISTDFYINTRNLNYIFDNINDIKNVNVLNESVHVFLWIAFLIAGLIFIFRITSIRIFIFTSIATALLMILSGLILVLIDYLRLDTKISFEFIGIYYALILGMIIILIPPLLLYKIRKSITGIFMNITAVCFPLFLFVIVLLISLHQKEVCRANFDSLSDCSTLIEYLGFWLSFLLLLSGFIFIYFYSGFIKKWRALPEK